MKVLFIAEATFSGANKGYQGPVTGVGAKAFDKLVRETNANTENREGPRLEDVSYYDQ